MIIAQSRIALPMFVDPAWSRIFQNDPLLTALSFFTCPWPYRRKYFQATMDELSAWVRFCESEPTGLERFHTLEPEWKCKYIACNPLEVCRKQFPRLVQYVELRGGLEVPWASTILVDFFIACECCLPLPNVFNFRVQKSQELQNVTMSCIELLWFAMLPLKGQIGLVARCWAQPIAWMA